MAARFCDVTARALLHRTLSTRFNQLVLVGRQRSETAAMPKCFIRTSRNYSGRLSQNADDKSRNHHRTVTRSGRRYIKPALPHIAKHRRPVTSRCRDRLDDVSYSHCSILQTSKFKYREKCKPWSQLSVVTRFYLGRQFPQLDVTGLKPHERPVWPDDFPCKWSHMYEEDYPMRGDQVCSPCSDHGDSDLQKESTTDLNNSSESSKESWNTVHFRPLHQSHHQAMVSHIEKLRALRLRPERPAANGVVLGPFRIADKAKKDLRLDHIRSLTGFDGRLLAKVFTIKSQTMSQNKGNSELKPGMMTLQLPVSVTTPVLRKTPFTNAESSKVVFNGDSSVWKKPTKPQPKSTNKSTQQTCTNKSAPGKVEMEDKTEKPAPSQEQKVAVGKSQTESASPTPYTRVSAKANEHSIPVIKIISTDKLGSRERHHKCSDCGRVFTLLAALTSHVRTHSRQRNKCDECGKVFTRSWLLKGHMRTHTGERPFLCPEPGCDKAFADKSNLRSHLLIHTVTTKSFVCQKCGRAFAQKRYLHKHMLEVCRLVPEGEELLRQ